MRFRFHSSGGAEMAVHVARRYAVRFAVLASVPKLRPPVLAVADSPLRTPSLHLVGEHDRCARAIVSTPHVSAVSVGRR